MAETGRPAQYNCVHWDARTNAIAPYEEVTSPLTPPDETAESLAQALERLTDEP